MKKLFFITFCILIGGLVFAEGAAEVTGEILRQALDQDISSIVGTYSGMLQNDTWSRRRTLRINADSTFTITFVSPVAPTESWSGTYRRTGSSLTFTSYENSKPFFFIACFSFPACRLRFI